MRLMLSVCAAMTVATLLISGCVTSYGTKVDADYVSKIERGKTTKAEIKSHMGNPQSTMNSGNAVDNETWVYEYVNPGSISSMVVADFTGKRPGSNAQSLTITFSGGVVKDYTFTESGPSH